MRVVVFDCDGTLVDSEPLARVAWERTLAPHGYTVTDEDLAACLGRPYPAVHGYFAARVALPDHEAFWPAFSGEMFGLLDTRLEPFADAVATVSELRDQGVPVAVASSSPRERLDWTLRRVGLSFAVTVAGDEVARGKPAPDMFLEAAARLGVAAGECVAVEDSPTGVAAAVAAGMTVVAVRRGGADGLGAAHVVLEELTAGAVLAAA